MAETKKNPAKASHKAALRRIELEKAEVELASLRVELQVDEHRLRGYKDERRKKDNEDHAHGVFTLDGGTGTAAVTLAAEMRKWSRDNPKKPVTLNIFSPGGSIFHGFVLYDTLRGLARKGHVITTVARGYAASMASIIFLAGDVRVVGEETHLMFHALSTMVAGSLHEIEDEAEFCKRLNARLDKIIVDRTKISAKMLKQHSHKKDWWVPADECLKLGVAHAID
jgi:ATP-dependent Clp protease protease subunit